MATMFDYLSWRGDIPFSRVPPNPVDALIFSTLAYTQFGDLITDDPFHPVFLGQAVEGFFAYPDREKRVRDKRDLELLLAAGESRRFRNVGVCFYRDVFLPEEETQFAALTFLLDDGTAFLCYRGTDYSLVGWKEDFNMSFQDTIPAQRKALAYAEEFAERFPGTMRFGGHSKGGNLAVFAAAKCGPGIRKRIENVYNLDGPGFREYLMGDEGYLELVPRIETYIPQSSIIGMLLEHEEEYTVIQSRQVSLMQHEPYSWEVMGGSFVQADGMSPDIQFLDATLKHWLAGMTVAERNEFVDTVYELLTSGGADMAYHLIRPQNIRALLKTLTEDRDMARILARELVNLIESARSTGKALAKREDERD